MSLTLITPTKGQRPRLFHVMQESILRQSVGYDQWLIVTDAKSLHSYNLLGNQRVVYREPTQYADLHPICANYLTGLQLARNDCIAFIEDDEAYLSPNYLEWCLDKLKTADLVGLKSAWYYNLPTRSYKCYQRQHASLCCTAMTRAVIPTFEQVARIGNPFIDSILWSHYKDTLKRSCYLVYNVMDVLSLKDGFGVGEGHRPKVSATWNGWITDNDHSFLKSKLGDLYEMLQDREFEEIWEYWRKKVENNSTAAQLATADYIGRILKDQLPVAMAQVLAEGISIEDRRDKEVDE